MVLDLCIILSWIRRDDFTGETNIMDRDSHFGQKQRSEVKNVLIDFVSYTSMQLFASQDII